MMRICMTLPTLSNLCNPCYLPSFLPQATVTRRLLLGVVSYSTEILMNRGMCVRMRNISADMNYLVFYSTCSCLP